MSPARLGRSSVAGGVGLAALVFSAWWGFAGTREEGGGVFALASRPAELTSVELAGDMRALPGTLELSALQAAQAPAPLASGDRVELDLELHPGGSLLIRTGRGVGVNTPTFSGPRGTAPPGGAPRPPPGGAGPGAGGGRPGQPPVDPRTEEARSPGIFVDFGARAEVRGHGGLVCPPVPLAAGQVHLALTPEARGVALEVNGTPVQCTGASLTGPWLLRPGVQRVRVHEVRVSRGGQLRWAFSGGGWATGWPAGLGVTAVAGLLGGLLGRRKPALAGVFLPGSIGPLLAATPLGGFLEAVRVLDVREALVPVTVAAVGVAVSACVAFARAWPLGRALAVAAVPALAILAGGRARPEAYGAALLASVLVPFTALIWANVRHVRGVGGWSWAALLVGLVLAEAGVRFTSVGDTWVRTAGYERAAAEFRELLELKTYRTYPSEGFPVRPPPARPGVARVVAFGGSSTGGAFQMDDIDQFWPKRLEERLGSGWEVVNQGVGGWNSLHIRLYVESQLDTLAPDVAVLYLGHNDLFTRGVASHAQLLDRYRRPPNAALGRVSDTLHASRLFVGFEFFLLSWRGRAAVAVPLADARENLTTILELAAARQTKVLLVNEGLNPDARPMAGYGAMLAELAAAHDARALDAAARFASDADPDDFLDDCHLTVEGHTRLAGWVFDDLRAAGWVP